MASYKKFQPNDVTSTKTLLHESVPMTGTLISGTYGSGDPDDTATNVRLFTHGMFESVYDYPYLSSSANHIFDIAEGWSTAATGNLGGLTAAAKKKRLNIYNSMAQVLAGFDVTGGVRQFDENGDLTEGSKYNNALFLNFSRLLYKDEIKKGSFKLKYYFTGSYASLDYTKLFTIADYNAINDYKVDSPAGEFGVLYVTENTGTTVRTDGTFQTDYPSLRQKGTNGYSFAGLLFYQAGVAVFPVSGSTDATGSTNGIFGGGAFPLAAGPVENAPTYSGSFGSGSLRRMIYSGSSNDIADNFRHRLYNIEFNNTTELNSSIYFCRVNHNDFNYSSNPSYLSASKIVVKDQPTDTPVSYITSVGLYDANNNLMAVAKLSEAIKKTPDTELVLRVRLDY